MKEGLTAQSGESLKSSLKIMKSNILMNPQQIVLRKFFSESKFYKVPEICCALFRIVDIEHIKTNSSALQDRKSRILHLIRSMEMKKSPSI